MAGFFGLFDYSRPGPGVSKNAPSKHRFFVFWEIFFRKIWELMKINLLYFLCCLPVVTIGPATAGFTYIMRNFARQEHAFLWMDFRDTVKANWKQSFLASVINAVIAALLGLTIRFYFLSYQSSHNIALLLPLALSGALALLFLFMQYYLYVMIITFNLKLSQIYKNALIFACVGVGRNFLITGVIALFVIAFYKAPFAVVILVPFLLLSFLGLLINFTVWPLIQRLMIDAKSGAKEEKISQDGAVFQDMGKQNKK